MEITSNENKTIFYSCLPSPQILAGRILEHLQAKLPYPGEQMAEDVRLYSFKLRADRLVRKGDYLDGDTFAFRVEVANDQRQVLPDVVSLL